mgnify:CR=1 FL=1
MVPDFGVVGVGNMRPVDMHHDADVRIAFGMAVAAGMRAAVDHDDVTAGLD